MKTESLELLEKAKTISDDINKRIDPLLPRQDQDKLNEITKETQDCKKELVKDADEGKMSQNYSVYQQAELDLEEARRKAELVLESLVPVETDALKKDIEKKIEQAYSIESKLSTNKDIEFVQDTSHLIYDYEMQGA